MPVYVKRKPCKHCGKDNHFSFQCFKIKKPINKQSDKEKEYQNWKEGVARPYLILRDGNYCSCCKRPARAREKLDIEHTLTKGSRPDLKKDLNNLKLFCRIPCHRLKTDGKLCVH